MRDDRARKSFYGEQMLEFAVLRELRIAFEKTVARRRRLPVRHAAFGRTLGGRVHVDPGGTLIFVGGGGAAVRCYSYTGAVLIRASFGRERQRAVVALREHERGVRRYIDYAAGETRCHGQLAATTISE